MSDGQPTFSNDYSDYQYPKHLAEREKKLIAARRKALPSAEKQEQAPGESVGVGLSGGGIRSATFCLGVFQSLAHAHLLRRIDYISTVSGGGYFGGFLGRLFARPYGDKKLTRAEHVEQVLSGECDKDVLRALRSNGRYIAPSGSGDELLFAAVLLRNWLSILTVLVVTLFAAFAWIEAIRSLAAFYDGFLWWESAFNRPDGFGASYMYWSGWFVVSLPLALLAFCLGAAYWIPRSSAWIAGLIAGLFAAGSIIGAYINPRVGATAWLGGGSLFFVIIWGALHAAKYDANRPTTQGANDSEHCKGSTSGTSQCTKVLQVDSKVRSLLSRAFTKIACAAALSVSFGLIDSLGRTIYALIELNIFKNWASWLAGGIAAMFGGGYIARIFAVVFAKRPGESRPAVSTSLLAGVAATLLALFLLISSSVAVQALTSQREVPAGAMKLDIYKNTELSWISRKQSDGSVLEVRETRPAADSGQPVATTARGGAPDNLHHFLVAIGWAGTLTVLAWLLGWSKNFLLLSSHHPIYSARLTRAYLGASNPGRMGGLNNMTEVMDGDDMALSDYYPIEGAETDSAIANGAPLHFINVTVNETVDGETRLQQQDRRGVGLALGPCGLSLGVRHHSMFWWHEVEAERRGLPSIADAVGSHPPGHQVFKERGAQPPEMLSLGRWISLSGAAFSTGLGSRTSVALSFVAGVFNIRLGHWWDPGLKRAWDSAAAPKRAEGGDPALKRANDADPALERAEDPVLAPKRRGDDFPALKPAENRDAASKSGENSDSAPKRTVALDVLKWASKVLDSFIVQRYLCREVFAMFPGTAKRFWYLSDGGHFENMGGYELIRRRLRKIVIIDGEADPDYTFEGLSDLVRKARLDFNAEITFLDRTELDALVADEFRPYFGTLDDLRRLDSSENNSVRSGKSRAHAALARVSYGSDPANQGLLLYIKPTLMGEESADVKQYHATHSDFPQEGTIDQFFDEAQWESYRKLGSHIGELLFAVPREKTGKFVPRDVLDWHARTPSKEALLKNVFIGVEQDARIAG